LEAKGKEVTTTEGLAPVGELFHLQKLFVEKAAMQYAF
jgi:aerobic-type carbon monoxide dehydrogenase small subunit (CoxS/CutS family)